MPSESEIFYEKLYRNGIKQPVFRGGLIESYVLDAAQLCPQGNALDLGAGDGRNALALAEAGLSVSTIELSPAGVEKMQRIAGERGLVINAAIGDIRDLDFGENRDIVVSAYTLHHLPRLDALTLIQRMQAATVKGGLNVLASFTNNADFFTKDPATKKFYLISDELRDLYAGWEIIKYEGDVLFNFVDDDGVKHTNESARILARRI